jgi:hypothetical protein
MLEKVKKYYEKEYEEAVTILNVEPRPFWVTPNEVVSNALQRGLGVCMFAQNIIPGENCSQLFDEFHTKMLELKKEYA